MTAFDILNPLANICLRFSEDDLNLISDWFEENAKPHLVVNNAEPTSVISVDKVIRFLELKKFHRRSFHYPNYAEIMTLVEKLKAGLAKILTKSQFIYMLNEWVLEPDLKHELILAFKVFDTEKRNFLDVEEIRSIVTGFGDVFNEAETVEMLRDANVRGDGNVFYEYFVDSMFDNAPELFKIKARFLYDDADEDPSIKPEPTVIVDEQPSVITTDALEQISKPAPSTMPTAVVKGKGKIKK